MGIDAWNDLPPVYQQVLVSACHEITLLTLARYDIENPRALERLTGEGGVTVRQFPEDIMEAAWSESDAYLREQAAANTDFRRIYDSWSEFRAHSFPYLAGNESAYAQFAFSKF